MIDPMLEAQTLPPCCQSVGVRTGCVQCRSHKPSVPCTQYPTHLELRPVTTSVWGLQRAWASLLVVRQVRATCRISPSVVTSSATAVSTASYAASATISLRCALYPPILPHIFHATYNFLSLAQLHECEAMVLLASLNPVPYTTTLAHVETCTPDSSSEHQHNAECLVVRMEGNSCCHTYAKYRGSSYSLNHR